MDSSRYLAMVSGSMPLGLPRRGGLSGLSGSSSRAMFFSALQEATKNADNYMQQVQSGTMVRVSNTGPGADWAFDPNGDPNLIFWLGTGMSGGMPPGPPDGYQNNGKSGQAIWRGSGISTAQKLIQASQNAQAAAAAAKAANDAAAAAQAQAQQQAQQQAQIAMNTAINQANNLARAGAFDQALQNLQNLQAQMIGIDATPLNNAIASITAQQSQAKAAIQAKSDAQAALDDALAAARQYAQRGQFDQADEMLSEAQPYARTIGVTASASIRQVQMFVDNARQQAKAQADAQAAAAAARQAAQQAAADQANQQAALQAQIAQAQAAAQQQAQAQAYAQQQAQMQMQMMMMQQQQAPQGAPQQGPQYAQVNQYVDNSGYSSGQMGPPPATYDGYASPDQAPVAPSPQPSFAADDVTFAGDSASVDTSGDAMADYYGLSGCGLGYLGADAVSAAHADTVKANRAVARLNDKKKVRLLVAGAIVAGIGYYYRDKIKKMIGR